ncbi:hypothetical protein, partial [Xanthomonas campestris]|uniref:hypothetical protein n=1 Tax=Xanthomonas campestris TaxID=339 RepID=UPI00265C7C4D
NYWESPNCYRITRVQKVRLHIFARRIERLKQENPAEAGFSFAEMYLDIAVARRTTHLCSSVSKCLLPRAEEANVSRIALTHNARLSSKAD